MAKDRPRFRNIPIVALALAWLVPGAGHMYVGRTARGIIVFLTISALFWAGMAIGGATTVDADRERWWFVAQMFTGMHGLAGWQIERAAMRRIAPGAEGAMIDPSVIDRRLAEEGVALVAPTDTVARAYAGVAGLLNLMCVFDAMMLSLMGAFGEPAPRPVRGKAEA